MLYALKGLAGLRHSEAAGLRWRDYDQQAEPLGAINLGKTKTQVPRRVPVHATLARVLAEWKLAGWERTYGRMPTPDDFITPTRNMTQRTAQETPKQLHEDLDTLGLRRRRGHDLRRTFVTLAQVDGARRDLLEAVSHGPRGDIVSVYTTFPWPALCEEVAKLKMGLRAGALLDGNFGSLATEFAANQKRVRNRWRKVVTPSGLEKAESTAKDHENSQSPTENEPAPEAKKCFTESDGSKVAKLATLAANAIRNADLHTALDLLREIGELCLNRTATGTRLLSLPSSFGSRREG